MQRDVPEHFLRDDQVLLIGLGGHKCASSWLYVFFDDHPECFCSKQKELNFFSDVDLGSTIWQLRRQVKKAQATLEEFHKKYRKSYADDLKIEMFQDLEKMSAHVHDNCVNAASLTLHGRYSQNFDARELDTKVCVDISPGYTAHGLENFENMKNAHSDTRFLFSMRDPAERTYSAYRYKKKLKDDPIPVDQDKRVLELIDFVENTDADKHTSYNHVFNALDAHIAPEKHMTVFYEKLFVDKTVKDICDFVGIAFVSGKYDRVVHRTNLDDDLIKMSHFEREFLVDRYKHVYKYIDDRFGLDAPDSWSWPLEIKNQRANRVNAG